MGSEYSDRDSDDRVTDTEDRVGAELKNLISELEPATIWLGLSGGLDSVVLLDILVRLAPSPWKISIVHVNHGLAEQADNWQAHCERLARHYGVQISSARVQVSRRGNVEANARSARYASFGAHVGSNDVLLTAHHADDWVETLLLKLMQGRAFAAMANRTRVAGITVIRPMLEVTQEELLDYATARQLKWVDDESNQDRRFDRNFLRHEILPLLHARWPNLHTKLQRLVDAHEGQQAALLHVLARYQTDGAALDALPSAPGAALAWLRAYVQVCEQYQVTDAALEEFLQQIRAGQQARVLWRGGGLELRDGSIHVVTGTKASGLKQSGPPQF